MTHFIKFLIALSILLNSGICLAFPDKWNLKNLNILLCPSFKKEKKHVQEVAKKWSKLTGLKFKIVNKSENKKVHIRICYVYDHTKMINKDKTIWAEATTKRGKYDHLFSAYIKFNSFTYNWNKLRTTFKKVLIHEFGHALGFGHSDSYKSVMHVNCPTTKLTKKDKQIARKKYKHFLKR